MSPRLTTVTGYPAATVTRCAMVNLRNPKQFCTIEDPHHQGDHYHEYSNRSWPPHPRDPEAGY